MSQPSPYTVSVGYPMTSPASSASTARRTFRGSGCSGLISRSMTPATLPGPTRVFDPRSANVTLAAPDDAGRGVGVVSALDPARLRPLLRPHLGQLPQRRHLPRAARHERRAARVALPRLRQADRGLRQRAGLRVPAAPRPRALLRREDEPALPAGGAARRACSRSASSRRSSSRCRTRRRRCGRSRSTAPISRCAWASSPPRSSTPSTCSFPTRSRFGGIVLGIATATLRGLPLDAVAHRRGRRLPRRLVSVHVPLQARARDGRAWASATRSSSRSPARGSAGRARSSCSSPAPSRARSTRWSRGSSASSTSFPRR